MVPGSILDVTLTAAHDPALAAALDWPGVPEHRAVLWPEALRGGADHADLVLYGSLHGPDEGPRVPVRVEEMWEIQGEIEPDPDQPHDGVRVRPGSQRRVPRDHVPARLACDLPEGADWPTPATVAVALRVSLAEPDLTKIVGD
jgi:hypothetical protein